MLCRGDNQLAGCAYSDRADIVVVATEVERRIESAVGEVARDRSRALIGKGAGIEEEQVFAVGQQKDARRRDWLGEERCAEVLIERERGGLHRTIRCEEAG